MTTWLVVWLVLTLLSILALTAVLAGVVRNALVLSRSIGRFSEEVGPLAAEIGQEGGRAADRGSNLQQPTRTPRR
jgi:hypothetical protein